MGAWKYPKWRLRQTVALFYGLEALEPDFLPHPINAMKPNHSIKTAGLLACTFLATAGFIPAQEATAPRIPADLEARRAAAMKKAELIREELTKASKAPRPQMTAEQKEKAVKEQVEAAAKLAEEQAARFAELKKIEAPEMPLNSYRAGERLLLEEQTRIRAISLELRLTEQKNLEKQRAKKILEGALLPESYTGQDGGLKEFDSLAGDRPLYRSSHNLIAGQTITSDQFRPFFGKKPLNLRGSGTTIAAWEIADPYFGHGEFLNSSSQLRLFDKDGYSGGNYGDSEHATHVFGTITSRGVNSEAIGMSPDATLHAYSAFGDTDEMLAIFTNGDPTDNIQVSNHSYGILAGWDYSAYYTHPLYGDIPRWRGDAVQGFVEDSIFGYYSTKAATIDSTAYTVNTYLPVWSSGNERAQPALFVNGYSIFAAWNSAATPPDYYLYQGAYPPSDGYPSGYDSVSHEGVAKNVLTVGSVADVPEGYKPGKTVSPSSFSSCGPTDDGRIKPDVVANGESLLSSTQSYYDHDNDVNTPAIQYAFFTGTSMAAPSVAGSVNLLTEYISRLYGPNRLAWASTLKGLVIHTADDFGADGPDYRSGWGLMNTLKAAQFLQDHVTNNSPLMYEISLANSSSWNLQITAVKGAVVPIKVTVVWTDPAATVFNLTSVDNAAARLVNDVNLSVSKPGGSIELPWILNRLNPSNAPSKGINNVDNVEQVVISNPVPGGTYTINLAPAAGETFVNDTGNSAPQAVSVFISGVQADGMDTRMTWNGGSSYSFTWIAKQGNVYRLETSTDLHDWVEISGDIAPTTTQVMSHTPTLTSGSKRFWRPKRINW